MPLLADYERRTAWKYEPIRGSFHTAGSLAAKVNPDGSFAPFSGSTAVFRPENRCLQLVRLLQEALYRRLDGAGLLADALPMSAIHMTLHDLVSPEACVSAAPEAFREETADSLRKAADIMAAIRRDYAGRRIGMVPDRVVNMVSKSLVLMLRPRTEEDYGLLLEMYRRFDGVRELPYPLTPHITLAYYRPGMLDGDALGAAVDSVQVSPENAPVFGFYPEALTAQRFSDMRSFWDVPARICFCCDGGLNRSVMAACILNHLAKKRNLPVTGEARSAYRETQGRPVPDQVWETLARHGVSPDGTYPLARYLDDREASWFTAFAAVTEGAMNRISWLNLPEEKAYGVSRFFFGVRDPEYGVITHEQAFSELYDRAERYLDAFEADCGKP